jgi:hypothetical protein
MPERGPRERNCILCSVTSGSFSGDRNKRFAFEQELTRNSGCARTFVTGGRSPNENWIAWRLR